MDQAIAPLVALRRRAGFLACGALATLAACVDLGSAEPAITWEAELVPALDQPELGGQAALVAQLSRTDAGIGIRGAQPGATHTWRVRMGTCATPGEGIGPESDYPQLVVNELGEASAEMQIGHRLTTDTSYHAEVRASPTDTTRIACGNFHLR